MPLSADSPLKDNITTLPGHAWITEALIEPAVGVPLQVCAVAWFNDDNNSIKNKKYLVNVE